MGKKIITKIRGMFMYILTTHHEFDSAHFLKGYNGKCANLHGHRWSVEVKVKGSNVEQSGEYRGMLVDFGKLKKDLEELTDIFDHKLLAEEGSLHEETEKAFNAEGFKISELSFRPTAENFAKYFYDEMKNKEYNVHSVSVYETPENCATYMEELI